MNFLLSFPKNLKEIGDLFLKQYEPNAIIVCGEARQHMRAKSERVCRFCGKSSGAVTFQKDAHIISQALGNKDLLSDFECDTCNELFGKFENDLSHCFADVLALEGVKGKNGTKTFKSAGKEVIIRRFEFKGKPFVHISRKEVENDNFDINHSTGESAIHFIKGKYIPHYVYRALLKMALSCLTETQISEYKFTLNYLLNARTDISHPFARVVCQQVPPTLEHRPPVAFIFQKKEQSAVIPTHIFMMRFANVYVQFPIPFNEKDLELLKQTGNQFDFPVCPPIFSNEVVELRSSPIQIDLSSAEKKEKADESSFGFQTDPKFYENPSVFDPKTETIKSSAEFEEIQGILMTTSGTVLSKEDLITISKIIEDLKAKNQ